MSLREQFEAWALKHKPKGMWKFENETAWQAFQAGHAANAVESKKTEAAILDLIKRLGKDQDKRCEDLKTYKNDFVTLEVTHEVYQEIMSVMHMLEDIDMGVYKSLAEFESEQKAKGGVDE